MPEQSPPRMDAHAEGHGHIYQARTQIIHQHVDRVRPAAVVVPVVAEAEAAERLFVGRGEMVDRLLGDLAPSGPVSAVVVTGLAGVGKTALARHTAARAVGRGWFPGGAVATDLHGFDPATRVAPDQVFASLLRALGVPGERIPPVPGEQATVYHQTLASMAEQGRPVLLVLDNVSEVDQVRDLLPAHRAHRVLITSRNTLGDLPGARGTDLEVLRPEDAVALLDASVRSRDPADRRIVDDPTGATRLAALCGHLPLAVRITASLLGDEPGLTVAEMVAELGDAGTRLAALSHADRSVRAAFDLSWRHLDADVARLFRLLPVNPGPELSTGAAAALTTEPEPRVRQRLRALRQAHLVEPGTAAGRWRLHDLVRLFAADLAEAEPAERQASQRRLLRYYRDGANAADDHLRALPGDAVPDQFSGRAAALAWLDTERPNLVAAVDRAVETGEYELASLLGATLGRYLSQRSHAKDHLTTATVAVEAARRCADPHGLGVAADNLGLALREARRFDEAIAAHTEGLRASRQAGDRGGEAIGLSNLGLALREVRRFDEAIAVHRRAVRICRDIGDQVTEGMALNGLGLVLQELHRVEEAIEPHRRAVDILTRIGDRHGLAMALNNLGTALRRTGRSGDAVEIQRRAVAAFRELADSPGEGTARANLGTALWVTGAATEAAGQLAEAAALLVEAGDSRGAGLALNNLGLVLGHLGRLDEAVDTGRRAVAVLHEAGDRVGEGVAWTSLGEVLRDAGRPARARECWERARAVLTEAGADEEVAEVHSLLAGLGDQP